jgi:hypothetical protein
MRITSHIYITGIIKDQFKEIRTIRGSDFCSMGTVLLAFILSMSIRTVPTVPRFPPPDLLTKWIVCIPAIRTAVLFITIRIRRAWDNIIILTITSFVGPAAG